MTSKHCARITAMLLIMGMMLGMPAGGRAEAEPFSPSGLSASDFIQQAHALLEEATGKLAKGSALVVFSDSKILHSHGFGHADLLNQRTILPEQTGFEYGSVTKVLTWISVMRLAEEGKLSLADDISHYLPADFYDRLRLRFPVTLLDLMNHRAGFEEYPLDMILPEGTKTPNLRDSLLQCAPYQRFQPGTVSAYSNFGCALAGYIVQCVSGQPFDQYISAHILSPLGMTSCGVGKEQAAQGMAQGTVALETGGFDDAGLSQVTLAPAGAVRGTAKDLAKLGMALLSRNLRLLPTADSFDRFFQDTFVPSPGMDGMAHGLFTMNAKGGKGYQHVGNTNGFTSLLSISPEKRMGFALLSNSAYANSLGMMLNHLFMGEGAQPQAFAQETPAPQSGYFLSGRNAFKLPYYSMLSYLNAYHLRVEGDNAVLTSAILRLAGFLGMDDMHLEAKRVNGNLYRVTNMPDMVETLYLETQDGQVHTVWSDGNALISLDQTPRPSFLLMLSALLLTLLLMLSFFFSLAIQGIAGLIRLMRKRPSRPPACWGLDMSAVALSAVYFSGLVYVATTESPSSQILNAYTAVLMAASIAAVLMIMYYGIRSKAIAWNKRTRGRLILKAAALVALIGLMVYWGQYQLV